MSQVVEDAKIYYNILAKVFDRIFMLGAVNNRLYFPPSPGFLTETYYFYNYYNL